MSARPDPRWLRRARRLLVVAGVVATLALGLRLAQVRRATAELERMALVPVPVDDLGGGFVVRPTRGGYRVRGADRGVSLLRDGDHFTVAGTEFCFHGPDRGRPAGDHAWSVVLAVPFRVYAARETADGPRGGFQRIDIGGDAAGASSGTRDRIYVDHSRVADAIEGPDRAHFDLTRGVAHLLPCDGAVFRLDHETFRIVAEIPGLELVRGDDRAALVVGDGVELHPGDRLVGPGTDLRFDLEDRWVSSPVRDRDGRVFAQRLVSEPTLVVRAPVPATSAARSRAYLTAVGAGGEPVALALAPDRPSRLYGTRDRLRPVDGRVIPRNWTHEELIEAFDTAVAAGAITLDRGFLRLASAGDPAAAHLQSLDPDLLRSLAREAQRFNHGQVPGTVVVRGRLGPELADASAGWSLVVDGEERPLIGLTPSGDGLVLPAPGEFRAAELPPGEERRWQLTRTLSLREADSMRLEIESDLPVAVAIDGEPAAWVRGAPALVQRDLTAGEHRLTLSVRYHGRPASYGQAAGARAEIEDAALLDAHVGRRRFVDWTDRADAGRVWQPAIAGADGAVWFPTGAPVGHDQVGYLQLRLRADRGGPSTLTLFTCGFLEEATLNGQPLPPDQLPYLAGESATIAVELRRGTNLVSLRVRQPTALPEDPRGGVRLRTDAGTLLGLAPDTGRRSMQAPSAADDGPALFARSAGTPRLVVARGVPGLAGGTQWWLDAPTRGDMALLLAPAGDVDPLTVLSLEDGLTVRCDPDQERPFSIVNRSSHAALLFRQIDPMRRPYQPFGGFLVRQGWAEPLREDRDAVRGTGAQVTYRVGTPTAVTSAVTLVREDGLHQLQVDGLAEIPAPEGLDGVDHLLVEPVDDGVAIQAAPGGTRVYRDGEVLYEVDDPADLPVVLAGGDAVSLPHSGLLLVLDVDPTAITPAGPIAESLGAVDGAARALRPRRAMLRDATAVVLTVEPVLQLRARDELEAQVALAERTLADAGLTLSPGPEGLRGAVVALDAADGAILAASSAGGDAGAHGAWGLAWTHPGSTFKIVTTLAALSSEDPDVAAMLAGDLPDGLREAQQGTLRGAELPRLEPADGRWSVDDDEPLRVRSPLRNFRRQPLPAGTDLEGALRLSSNVYFGYLALLMHRPLREGWAGAGIADPALRDELLPLVATARELGFGEVLDLVPPGLAADNGRCPPVIDRDDRPVAAGDALHAWTGRLPEGPLDDVAMAASGVGQGEVYTTPLQMARVAATLVRGERIVPALIHAVDGRERPAAVSTAVDLPAETLERTREGLRGGVLDGTASTAFCDNPYRARIWGKTGSSERPGPDGGHVTDSWFVGVIEPPDVDLESADPTRHPVAVACVVPGAGLGGTHAAEVADRLMREVARLRGWEMAPGR